MLRVEAPAMATIAFGGRPCQARSAGTSPPRRAWRRLPARGPVPIEDALAGAPKDSDALDPAPQAAARSPQSEDPARREARSPPEGGRGGFLSQPDLAARTRAKFRQTLVGVVEDEIGDAPVTGAGLAGVVEQRWHHASPATWNRQSRLSDRSRLRGSRGLIGPHPLKRNNGGSPTLRSCRRRSVSAPRRRQDRRGRSRTSGVRQVAVLGGFVSHRLGVRLLAGVKG